VTMLFGKGKGKEAQAPIPVVPLTPATPQDPNAWMISNPIADFLLMSTFEIQCLCIFGYALVHGMCIMLNGHYYLPMKNTLKPKFDCLLTE